MILFKEAAGQTRLSVRTRDGGVDATELTGLWGGAVTPGQPGRQSTCRSTRPTASCWMPARKLIERGRKRRRELAVTRAPGGSRAARLDGVIIVAKEPGRPRTTWWA